MHEELTESFSWFSENKTAFELFEDTVSKTVIEWKRSRYTGKTTPRMQKSQKLWFEL